jgi:hypothetical protein
MVLGVSSTMYMMKSSPKDFSVLCLLLLLGASSLSSLGCSINVGEFY